MPKIRRQGARRRAIAIAIAKPINAGCGLWARNPEGRGLLVTGLLVSSLPPNEWIKWSGLMLTGIVLFPGSLYLLALGLPRWLGVVTPLGGFSFILAWACVVMAVINTWNL